MKKNNLLISVLLIVSCIIFFSCEKSKYLNNAKTKDKEKLVKIPICLLKPKIIKINKKIDTNLAKKYLEGKVIGVEPEIDFNILEKYFFVKREFMTHKNFKIYPDNLYEINNNVYIGFLYGYYQDDNVSHTFFHIGLAFKQDTLKSIFLLNTNFSTHKQVNMDHYENEKSIRIEYYRPCTQDCKTHAISFASSPKDKIFEDYWGFSEKHDTFIEINKVEEFNLESINKETKNFEKTDTIYIRQKNCK